MHPPLIMQNIGADMKSTCMKMLMVHNEAQWDQISLSNNSSIASLEDAAFDNFSMVYNYGFSAWNED